MEESVLVNQSFTQAQADFCEQLEIYCSERNLLEPLDESHIQRVIDTIDNNSIISPYDLTKYIVKEVNGVKKLFLKNNLLVVPFEDFFDILWMYHVDANHCKSFKLRSMVEGNGIYIPFYAAIILVQCCPKCSNKNTPQKNSETCKKSAKSLPYRRGYLQVLDMTKFPDGNYNYILTYMDLTTHFLFFRPLASITCKKKNTNDLKKDVAAELLKIFLEFGGPVILHSNSRSYTKSIISLLPDLKIIVGTPDVPTEYNYDLILNALKDWMAENKTGKWSIGVYHVQYLINAMHHKNINKSPFKALFRVEPKLGLTLEVPKDVDLDLLTEENQLKEIFPKAKMKEISSKEVVADTNTNKPEIKQGHVLKTKLTENESDELVVTKVNFPEITPKQSENYFSKESLFNESNSSRIIELSDDEVLETEEPPNKMVKIDHMANDVEEVKNDELAKIIKTENSEVDYINDILYSTPGPSMSCRLIMEDDDLEWCHVCEKIDETATVSCFICSGKVHKRCGNKNNCDNTFICKLCLKKCAETSSSSDEE